MNHKQIDIERAVDSINAERAAEYEKATQATIDEIMTDGDSIWSSMDDDSKEALWDFMVCNTKSDTSEAWEDFYETAFKLKSMLICDIALAAELDTVAPEPASREDAIDHLEMRESEDEC